MVIQILQKWNLKMNHSETETIEIVENGNWRTCKKLGMTFDPKKE